MTKKKRRVSVNTLCFPSIEPILSEIPDPKSDGLTFLSHKVCLTLTSLHGLADVDLMSTEM